jgi:hypothetical protein
MPGGLVTGGGGGLVTAAMQKQIQSLLYTRSCFVVLVGEG